MSNEAQSGTHLFEDVFRRADKNDDNILSLEEFFSYFKDDLLTKEDLTTMFKRADTDQSGTISLEELIEYFKKDFQPYGKLFAALEQVHASLSDIFNTTSRSYNSLDFFQQFKARFFLREFVNQLTSLKKPVDSALENMEKTTATVHKRTLNFESHDAGVFAHHHHHAHHATDPALQLQVDRLAKLVGALEAKTLRVEVGEEELVTSKDSQDFVLISRKMEVLQDDITPFEEQLKKYIRAVSKETGCYQTFVKRITDSSTCFLYEIWETKESYELHLRSPIYKEHMKANIEYLSRPEHVQELSVPSSWFPKH